jgi:hypothetical protein
MKAYTLLALMVAVGPPLAGTPASAQSFPDELRPLYQENFERRDIRDGIRETLIHLHRACEDGERRACIHFGIIVGENREHREEWRREHPEWFATWSRP